MARAARMPVNDMAGSGKSDRPLERRSEESRHTVLDSRLKKIEPLVRQCSASEAPVLRREAEQAIGSGPSDHTEGVDSTDERHRCSKKAFVV